MPTKEEQQQKDKWKRELNDALDCDCWGQVIEAAEQYEALATSLRNYETTRQSSSTDRYHLSVLSIILLSRARSLSKAEREISLTELKGCTGALDALFTGTIDHVRLPVDVSALSGASQMEKKKEAPSGVSASIPIPAPGEKAAPGQNLAVGARGGTLYPQPPPFASGGTMLVLTVEKIGLKNATQYLKPMMTVSWYADGHMLEEAQDLPISAKKREQFVEFNIDVYQQSPIEEFLARSRNLPDGDDAAPAIFFEFKHYKPKKDKVSTKCWSFLPISAIQEGPIVLEIYEKPTDLKCKRLKLLSAKPLYLHLRAALVPH